MKHQIFTAVLMLLVLTVLLGVIYPAVMTGVSQAVFNRRANGSLIESNCNVAGSEFIGQPFSDPKYFWGRLSATAPFPYNAAASAGSNLGPANPAFYNIVQARIDALTVIDPGNTLPIPVDLVTASGSGLDPHISVAAAYYQISRVADIRHLNVAVVTTLVKKNTEGRQWGIFGEPRVNVLKLNLDLDNLH